MAARLGGRAGLLRPQPGARSGAREEVLHAGNAPVSVRHAAHGPRAQLHAGRRPHPFPPAKRRRRPAAHGLRLLRPAGGKRGHPGGRAPARDHRAQHRAHPRRDAPARVGGRLGSRGLCARAGVLPVDAVAVPEVLRGRARLPEGGARQLVPERPDGGRERVRDRWEMRAVRRRGDRDEHGAVVLPDHRVRGPAAG